MFEQYGNLQHTHFPGPMRIALDQLEARGVTPDLVVSDHGMGGYAASTRKLLTIGIADCNDPGLFVAGAVHLEDKPPADNHTNAPGRCNQ